jgi:RNA polymerase sigma-70 factor (ECF subfamily)
MNQREDREDLIQEIIFQLWKAFDSYQGKAARSTWVYRVAMNVAIYHYNQSKKKLSILPINQEILKLEAENSMQNNAQWESMQKYIQHLNLLEKGILMLYLEEKTYAEIANIIGISESNVGTRLSRIKQKLRKLRSKK